MNQERLFPQVPERETTQAPLGAPNTCRSDARLYRPVRNQVEMVMRDLDSFVPKDHLARAIWKVVESFDLSVFYAPIKAVIGEPGHPATDPQVLVALWIYATAEGVGKARQLVGSATSMMPTAGSAVECRSTITCSRISVWRTARPSMA